MCTICSPGNRSHHHYIAALGTYHYLGHIGMDATPGGSSHCYGTDPFGLRYSPRQIHMAVTSGLIIHREARGVPASVDILSQASKADIFACTVDGYLLRVFGGGFALATFALLSHRAKLTTCVCIPCVANIHGFTWLVCRRWSYITSAWSICPSMPLLKDRQGFATWQ
jgi:hypothetical protein